VNDALPRFFCRLRPWGHPQVRPHRLPNRFTPLPFDTRREEGRFCLREGEEDVTDSLPVHFPRFRRPLRRYICGVHPSLPFERDSIHVRWIYTWAEQIPFCKPCRC